MRVLTRCGGVLIPISNSNRSRSSFGGTITVTGHGGTTLRLVCIGSAEGIPLDPRCRSELARTCGSVRCRFLSRVVAFTLGRKVRIGGSMAGNGPVALVTRTFPGRCGVSLVIVKTANGNTVAETFIKSISGCIIHRTPYSILIIHAWG